MSLGVLVISLDPVMMELFHLLSPYEPSYWMLDSAERKGEGWRVPALEENRCSNQLLQDCAAGTAVRLCAGYRVRKVGSCRSG